MPLPYRPHAIIVLLNSCPLMRYHYQVSLWRRVGVQCERRAMTVNGTMETAHYRERSDVSSAPGGHGVMLGRPGQMPSHLVFRPAS